MALYTLPNRRSIVPSDSFRNNPDAVSMTINTLAITGTPVPSGQFFHFRFSLISQTTDNREVSIRLDMLPRLLGLNPMRGYVLVEYKPYAITNNVGPASFFVEVRPNTSAHELLLAIFDQHKMDQYIFKEPGVGCRFWCASVLDRLAQNGFIPHNIAERFRQYEVQQNGRFGNSMFRLPGYEGEFYI